jgi:hypothetical protein
MHPHIQYKYGFSKIYEKPNFKRFSFTLTSFLTLFLLLAAGDTNCCRICFFSTAFFLVGVELFLFFLGDGVPVEILSYFHHSSLNFHLVFFSNKKNLFFPTIYIESSTLRCTTQALYTFSEGMH